MPTCATCCYFDPERARRDDRLGGYCDMMRSDFDVSPHLEDGQPPQTLAYAVDAAYGRGDRVEVLVVPNFGCVMHEERKPT